MGAYRYCDQCKAGLPAPWDRTYFPVEEVMRKLFENPDDPWSYYITCPHCEKPVGYDKQQVAENLGEYFTELELRISILENKLTGE